MEVWALEAYGASYALQELLTIKSDDTVECWGVESGWKYYGQTNVPVGLGSVKSVSAGGGYHTCAIKADDTVECWGWDSSGQSTVPAELQ